MMARFRVHFKGGSTDIIAGKGIVDAMRDNDYTHDMLLGIIKYENLSKTNRVIETHTLA